MQLVLEIRSLVTYNLSMLLINKYDQGTRDALALFKLSAMAPWMGAVARHAIVGAAPGAVLGALNAEPGHVGEGALKGGLLGAGAGVGIGHIGARVSRYSGALTDTLAASPHAGMSFEKFMQQPYAFKQPITDKAQALASTRPIYG